MKPKDYQDISNLLGTSPGFATTVFVSWEDIGYIFNVDEYWSLTKEADPVPLDIMSAAFQEAQEWLTVFKATRNTEPSEEDLVSIENQIARSIMDHWSYAKVISNNIDFDILVEGINSWCQSGPKQSELFINPPAPKIGLKHFINDMGINFTVYPAFIVPYTELYYKAYENLPEWNLEDIEGGDIAETLYLYADHSKQSLTFDLRNWDNERKKLS